MRMTEQHLETAFNDLESADLAGRHRDATHALMQISLSTVKAIHSIADSLEAMSSAARNSRAFEDDEV